MAELTTSKYVRVPAAILAALFLLVSSMSAATLSEYKEQVVHLKGDMRRLLYPETEEEIAGVAELREVVYEEVIELAKESQSVEFGNSEAEIDWTWMRDKMNEFRDTRKDEIERRLILMSIHERLGAIEQAIEELEYEEGVAASKDENKRKLSEILKREEYRKPAEEEDDSLIQRFLKWLDEWLKGILPERQATPQVPDAGPGAIGYILQIIVYAVVIVLVGYLFYRFAPLLLSHIQKRRRIRGRDQIVLGERISAGITTASLFSEAEALAAEGKLRDAVRKGYIAALYELSQRKVIGLAKHKTNRDYLRDVGRRRPVYGSFSGLTSSYERHWYGSESVEQEDWESFRAGYQETMNSGT